MEQILTALLDYLRTIPGIFDAQVFNNQLKHLSQELETFYPVVYVEPTNLQYATLSGPFQQVSCTLRLHIVNNSPHQGRELDIYVLKDLVHRYLFEYTANGWLHPLQRVREQLDYQHNNLYDYQVEYTTLFRDEVQPLDEQTVVLQHVHLDYDVKAHEEGYHFPDERQDDLP